MAGVRCVAGVCTGPGFLAATALFRATETGLSRVSFAKGPGKIKAIPPRRETGFTQDGVVDLARLEPAPEWLWISGLGDPQLVDPFAWANTCEKTGILHSVRPQERHEVPSVGPQREQYDR